VLTRIIAALSLGFSLAAWGVTSAIAAPVTFNFTFAGNGATATGFITFESTLLNNPGNNDFELPNPAVLALHVTVSGASAGNGNFNIGSFNEVFFNTNGGTLDFSHALVGQPTSGSPWGTPDSDGGDFNLFSAAPPGPRGVDFFTLGANGGDAQAMTLTTMALAAPASAAVATPTLEDWNLIALAALLGIAGAFLLRRREFARIST
jgi:hypothetical protein